MRLLGLALLCLCLSDTLSSPVLNSSLAVHQSQKHSHLHHHYAKHTRHVLVLHYLLAYWGAASISSANYTCDKHVFCEWVVGETLLDLQRYVDSISRPRSLLTVGLYNIHTLWEKFRVPRPRTCILETNISMYETEESAVRYSWLFDKARPYFDAYSSTSPKAEVQRVYAEAFLNESLLLPLKPFSSLIKAGSYLASDCHRHDFANSNRDGVVQMIRKQGFRVDGLGRCLHTDHIPEGIDQKRLQSARYDLVLKREVIASYAFHMAFENSFEEGYVTEKPFDALIAGTVPVYLGDGKHLKSLIPHPKSVIFVEDFENLALLAKYLNYLISNETAYEEHRSWRRNFSYERNLRDKPLLLKSWQCRVCEWAAKQQSLLLHHRTASADFSSKISNQRCPKPAKLSQEKENSLYRRSDARAIYVVKEGVLRLIPDFQTFVSMGYDTAKVQAVDPLDFENMIIGEELPRSHS